MTNAQAEWLKAHPEYEAVGRPAAFIEYTKQFMLHPDGKTVRSTFKSPAQAAPGAFLVGIKGDSRARGQQGTVDPRAGYLAEGSWNKGGGGMSGKGGM